MLLRRSSPASLFRFVAGFWSRVFETKGRQSSCLLGREDEYSYSKPKQLYAGDPQAKMALNRSFTLNDGSKIPAVGFGTWQAKPHEVERAVEVALRSGYRHIDCAAIYRNETEVGEGIRKSGVNREDIWLTGKLWNTNHAPEDVEKGLDKTLKDLGVEYLDLFLMHWPT